MRRAAQTCLCHRGQPLESGGHQDRAPAFTESEWPTEASLVKPRRTLIPGGMDVGDLGAAGRAARPVMRGQIREEPTLKIDTQAALRAAASGMSAVLRKYCERLPDPGAGRPGWSPWAERGVARWRPGLAGQD